MNRRSFLRKLGTVAGVAAVAPSAMLVERSREESRQFVGVCFSEVRLSTKKLAVLIRVPNELLRSAVPVESTIFASMAEKISSEIERA